MERIQTCVQTIGHVKFENDASFPIKRTKTAAGFENRNSSFIRKSPLRWQEDSRVLKNDPTVLCRQQAGRGVVGGRSMPPAFAGVANHVRLPTEPGLPPERGWSGVM